MLFYLKSGEIVQELNINGRTTHQKTKTFLERISACSNTRVLSMCNSHVFKWLCEHECSMFLLVIS